MQQSASHPTALKWCRRCEPKTSFRTKVNTDPRTSHRFHSNKRESERKKWIRPPFCRARFKAAPACARRTKTTEADRRRHTHCCRSSSSCNGDRPSSLQQSRRLRFKSDTFLPKLTFRGAIHKTFSRCDPFAVSQLDVDVKLALALARRLRSLRTIL